jgi:hypothetical protein
MRIVEPRPEQIEIIAPTGVARRIVPWHRARLAAYFAPSDHAPDSVHERRRRPRPPRDPRMGRIVDLRI